MNISISTDYASYTGNASIYLQRISECGFTHVNWCHEWCTDHIYSQSEIDMIKQNLDKFSLQVLDIHGSEGLNNNWMSQIEKERQEGILIVKNRISMAAQLGADVLVMHVPYDLNNTVAVHKTLDEIQPLCDSLKVRIAIENTYNHEAIRSLLQDYDSSYLGLCYDSGHGNIPDDGLVFLDSMKDRLISIHLHDNDGIDDTHDMPFTGTVDWEHLIRILAESSYDGCVSLELCMFFRYNEKHWRSFLADSYNVGKQLACLLETERHKRN